MGEGKIDNKRILFVKPQTYMNLSGESILEVMKFYKENIENLIVIFDDIDISLGKIRIKGNGSAGTHNGVKSIVNLLKTEDFKRIKIGVGSPNEIGLVDFVLGKFSREEMDIIEKSMKNASEAIKMIVQEEKLTGAMNKYN
jgi:PTH1 family peptidyl-tRNA hydrolase